MAKISTYPLSDLPLNLSDILIGTEVGGPIPNATKNFSLGQLSTFINSFVNLQTVLNNGNTATEDINLTGDIVLTGGFYASGDAEIQQNLTIGANAYFLSEAFLGKIRLNSSLGNAGDVIRSTGTVAVWSPGTSIYTIGDGLTLTGSTISWGGVLNGGALIDGQGPNSVEFFDVREFSVTQGGGTIERLYIGDFASYLGTGSSPETTRVGVDNDLSTFKNYAFLNSQNAAGSFSQISVYDEEIRFFIDNFSGNGKWVVDNLQTQPTTTGYEALIIDSVTNEVKKTSIAAASTPNLDQVLGVGDTATNKDLIIFGSVSGIDLGRITLSYLNRSVKIEELALPGFIGEYTAFGMLLKTPGLLQTSIIASQTGTGNNTLTLPDTNSGVLALSVNGVAANAQGNISIPVGGTQNLQQTLTIGNTANLEIELSEWFRSDKGLKIEDTFNSTYFTLTTKPVSGFGISGALQLFYDTTPTYPIFEFAPGGLWMTKSIGLSTVTAVLSMNNITASRGLDLPDEAGTLALSVNGIFADAQGDITLPLGGNFWSLSGNAGTTPGTDFIGTTDLQDVIFKANGIERLKIDAATGDIYTPKSFRAVGSTATSVQAFSTSGNGGVIISQDSTDKGYIGVSNGSGDVVIKSTLLTGNHTIQLPNDSGIFALSVNGIVPNAAGDIALSIPTIPSLSQVTAVGNITPDDIRVISSSGASGISVESSSGADGTSRIGFTTAWKGHLLLNNGVSSAVLRANNITTSKPNIQLPDSNGTLAMSVNGVSAGATGNIVIPTGTGTVTSVGVTVPSAFNVAGSPITTSGTIAITGAGLPSQYVRGDGSLADFPTAIGGGSSVSYYLNGGTGQGTFSGITFFELGRNAIVGPNADFTRTDAQGDGYIASFVTDPNDPDLLSIPAGNWNLQFYFSATSGGGTPSFYGELYKMDSGGSLTLLATGSGAPEVITGGTSIDAYYTSIPVPLSSLNASDRIAVRVWVNTAGRDITLHTQGVHLSQVVTTFSSGIAALNGLIDQNQFFTVGTSGSTFNISSSGNTHTFNLPLSSASNVGALSPTDWTTFNNKQDLLVSGTNIKTINGTSLLGSGDISIAGVSAVTATSPLSSSGGLLPNISIANAAADGSTKGAATFTASDFNDNGSGLISIDYVSGQSASSISKGFLTSSDWTLFNSKQDALVSGTNIKTINGSSILGSGDLIVGSVTNVSALTLGTSGTDLSSSVANGTTTPVITLNVPTASATNRGALSSADWTTFNNKQNAVSLTTTGNSGPATFNPSTGALNVPQYGGTGGSGFGYTLMLGFNVTPFAASTTYVTGNFYGSTALPIAQSRPSRWVLAPKVGTIVSASIICQLQAATYASPSSSVLTIRINNLTQGTSSIIDNAFPIGSSLSWSGSPPARNTFYTLASPLSINQGDQIQVQIVTPAWASAPADITMNLLLFIE